MTVTETTTILSEDTLRSALATDRARARHRRLPHRSRSRGERC